MAENNENTEFMDLVKASQTLSERYARVQTQVLQDAQRLYGLDLDTADVGSLAAVRVAVLADQPLEDTYTSELSRLPRVTGAVASKEAKSEKTLPSQGLAQKRLDAARACGVELGAPGGQLDIASLPPSEQIALILTRSPSDRISLARELGLA